MILSDLSNLPGVSGNEDLVREYIQNEIFPFCDTVTVDRAGNLIGYVRGEPTNGAATKVMLCAHMDEVGFIISDIDRSGNLKFLPVGGMDARVLPGCRVLVGDQDVKGIIGTKPIHLQSEGEFKKAFPMESLRIDIGSDNKKQTDKLVEPGDYAVFDTEFEEFGDGLYAGKALDDRAGCAILIELLRNLKSLSFDLYVCFSTKEEIGCVGAKVLANTILPDIAIAIEGTTCADLPGVEPHKVSTTLGKGPVLAFMDGGSIADKELNAFLEQVAKENNIPYQYKNTTTGGNDAAAFQRTARGARVASISVPCRYLHSPVSVISQQDYDNSFYLVSHVVDTLSKQGGKLHV